MSEENKYNIKINSPKPNKEAIRNKMDFEGAFKAYTHKVYRTPWARFQRHSSKNRKASMFIILMIIVGTLVFLESEESGNKNNQLPNQQDTKNIQLDSLNKN